MDPKFQVGDRVDHRSVFCKRNGRIEAVIERTVYMLYRVRFPHCSGDFFETELAPAILPAPIEQKVDHDQSI